MPPRSGWVQGGGEEQEESELFKACNSTFFFFFPRQLKWKRDTIRTALPLTGLHPPVPSSALIIILTKALSK